MKWLCGRNKVMLQCELRWFIAIGSQVSLCLGNYLSCIGDKPPNTGCTSLSGHPFVDDMMSLKGIDYRST